MSKRDKKFLIIGAVILVIIILGVIISKSIDNTMESSRIAANARTVEGHIRNIELAIISKAFDAETGDLTLYDVTDDPISKELESTLPSGDTVKCEKYTIENGTVKSAGRCYSSNWKYNYTYTNSGGATVIKDNSNYNNSNNTSYNNNNSNASTNATKKATKKVYNFDETFVFDDLEITIGSGYSFVTIQNRYSEKNGATVVKLPVTVKNLSNDTHGLNMFYYDIYGSTGTEVASANAYFDEALAYAGDLRSGASYTKYMYFIYDGNGKYAIEFDDWSTKVTAEFEITK